MLEAGGQVHKIHSYPSGIRLGTEIEAGASSQEEEAGKSPSSLPSSAQNRSDPGLRGLWILCAA